jgi:ribonuclease PH
MRPDGRQPDELRPITFERDYTDMTPGSVLVSFGRTKVLCTASVEDDVPRWMRGRGTGWVTAEYAMLPGSSPERIQRKVSGRTQEIQRLIGRSLRAVCDMAVLGVKLITVDCDVLQADGGTRTASISGGYLALFGTCTRLVQSGMLNANPLTDQCAAISVGIVGHAVLDLPYIEDVKAGSTWFHRHDRQWPSSEVQGTAEGLPFSRGELDAMLGLAEKGIAEIVGMQRELSAVEPRHRATAAR